MTSVVMYAAPVRVKLFHRPQIKSIDLCVFLQRCIAIRTIAAYRTVSFDAATVLARIPPWRFEAVLRYRIYSRLTDLKARNECSHHADIEIRNGESLLLVRQWDISLSKPGIWGRRTIIDLQPSLYKWLSREFGEVNYYVTKCSLGMVILDIFYTELTEERQQNVYIAPHLTIR